MARIEFDLKTGITVGTGDKQKTLTHVVLRELTAGDIIEAQEESEKLVYKPVGDKIEPVLVTSPTAMGINVLCRQILEIGGTSGPIPINLLKKLTESDFALIQQKAQELDDAGMELADRGRNDADSRDA